MGNNFLHPFFINHIVMNIITYISTLQQIYSRCVFAEITLSLGAHPLLTMSYPVGSLLFTKSAS